MNVFKKALQKKELGWISIILFFITIPLIIFSQDVLAGEISFWYDPARDFLHALDNLKDVTLIGPTSGIPGVFYGPYWIWLISIGVLINKDPRLTVFLLGIIPYLVLFPLILFSFRKYMSKGVVIALWIFFVLSYGGIYATNLWNPHIAPLLFFILIFSLTTTDFSKTNRKIYLKIFCTGLIAGLIINFHISFGIGVIISSVVWLICVLLLTHKYVLKEFNLNKLVKKVMLPVIIYAFGVICVFAPFFLFEIKHGFNQMRTTLTTLTAEGSVVSVIGINDREILQSFFDRGAQLFHISISQFYICLALLVLVTFVFIWLKKLQITIFEKKLISFICVASIGVLTIYLTSKNPVWQYHFIGVEILFLLLIGVLANKFLVFRILLIVWSLVVVYSSLGSLIHRFTNNPLKESNLAAKMHIVDIVYSDAKERNFEVYAYSPSIYIYDYAYLFSWLGEKKLSYKPEDTLASQDLVYVILPLESPAKLEDFIEYRTPSEYYRTTKEIKTPDGTLILKREKIKE